mgnify:CR=1 FL=1
MKNNQVIEAFICGRKGRAGRLRTDGQTLYSYELKIGETRGAQKVVFNYTEKGDYQSHTTTRHVNAAKRAGALLIEVGG